MHDIHFPVVTKPEMPDAGIAEAFRYARQHLWDGRGAEPVANELQGVRSDRYICCILNAGERMDPFRQLYAAERARDVLRQGLRGTFTVESWLDMYRSIDTAVLGQSYVQCCRAAWLDALIEAYSPAGEVAHG